VIPVLYAHGAGAGPEDVPLPALRRLLGPGYAITAPDLGPPDPGEWTARLHKALRALPDRAVLIGHSLGGSHLLRCAAELSLELQLRGIVTLAAPFWGAEDWQNDGFALPVYAEQALATFPIRLFHGAEDTDVPPAHMQALSHALPRARHYLLPGQDHGFDGDLSPVTMAIAEL
jgi:predicted alpha/beta hydrolase family esterase